MCMKHNSTHEALKKRGMDDFQFPNQYNETTYTLTVGDGTSYDYDPNDPDQLPRVSGNTMYGLTLDQVLDTIRNYVYQYPLNDFTVEEEDPTMTEQMPLENQQRRF